jgi:hypothetical protein
MEKRMNDNWEIVGSMEVGKEGDHTFEVVLGYRETKFGDEWVVWDCSDRNNYYWGNYYDDKEKAVKKFYERIMMSIK